MHPSRSFLQSAMKRTPLYSWHVAQGAKMVPFCGWDMPVQYKPGVKQEHIACREGAAIFDVSHMGQLRWTGKDRHRFLQWVTPVSLDDAPVGGARLSVLTTAKGGVVDDTMITRQEDHVYMVINAGCTDKDLVHLKDRLAEFKGDVKMEHLNHLALIALQGPKAMPIVQKLVGSGVDLTKMPFMTGQRFKVAGMDTYVTRCGYTGEDGFEISVDPTKDDPAKLASIFMEHGATPAGLGSRDSLRLEAGLCLYGHELNEDISPIEAGLLFVITKQRREAGGYLGAERVISDIKNGTAKKRVGLIIDGAPARENAKVLSTDGAEIGIVTSGGPSPTLKKPIAMAYLPSKLSKAGTKVAVEVRGKAHPAVVTKLPFVPTNYFRVQ